MIKSNGKGWVRDLPDQRDLKYKISNGKLSAQIDLRSQCPNVYDQGQLGSCTANAIAGALEFDRKKQNVVDFSPSRLFIYYNERAMEGTIKSDSGATIRDGIKSVNKSGDCPETEWPYDITKFSSKPSKSCYKDALKYKSVLYSSISQDLNSMKDCLSSGFPFVYGFTVYNSFESASVAKNGIVPMPTKKEKTLDGHAVMAVGYDDSKNWFICRNSWGISWGDKGYFYMPYAYLINPNLASDFWTIKTVLG